MALDESTAVSSYNSPWLANSKAIGEMLEVFKAS
jgi:hypothetical protein